MRLVPMTPSMNSLIMRFSPGTVSLFESSILFHIRITFRFNAKEKKTRDENKEVDDCCIPAGPAKGRGGGG